MNQHVKYQYNNGTIEFYITYKGAKVIVLAAKPEHADLKDLWRLMRVARGNAVVVLSELRLVG